MIEFQAPLFLFLLIALIPFAWWSLRRSRKRSAAIQYSDVRLFQAVPLGKMLFWRRMLPILRLAALALLIIGMARPRFGTVERDVIKEGVDLFYCLDVSGSMRAEDFVPNRLEEAKKLTADFAARRKTDRQGLAIFAGEAFVLCPLTYDNNTVQEFLKKVDFTSVSVDGTSIGMGLSRALKKLQNSKAKSRVIILMTDGVNNAGQISPQQAATAAKALGVKIYTIGIGSRGMASITLNGPFGPQRQQIETDLDEDLLKKVASDTGGIYRRATSGAELDQILREIDSLEKTEIELKEYRTYDERMSLLLWPALALILLELLLANTRFLKIP